MILKITTEIVRNLNALANRKGQLFATCHDVCTDVGTFSKLGGNLLQIRSGHMDDRIWLRLMQDLARIIRDNDSSIFPLRKDTRQINTYIFQVNRPNDLQSFTL